MKLPTCYQPLLAIVLFLAVTSPLLSAAEGSAEMQDVDLKEKKSEIQQFRDRLTTLLAQDDEEIQALEGKPLSPDQQTSLQERKLELASLQSRLQHTLQANSLKESEKEIMVMENLVAQNTAELASLSTFGSYFNPFSYGDPRYHELSSNLPGQQKILAHWKTQYRGASAAEYTSLVGLEQEVADLQEKLVAFQQALQHQDEGKQNGILPEQKDGGGEHLAAIAEVEQAIGNG